MQKEIVREGVLKRPGAEPVNVQIVDLGEEKLEEKGATPNHDKVEVFLSRAAIIKILLKNVVHLTFYYHWLMLLA